MLTISDLIAVLSLCLTTFGLGYSIGKSNRYKNNRPEPENLSGYLHKYNQTNRLSVALLYTAIVTSNFFLSIKNIQKTHMVEFAVRHSCKFL